MRSERILLAVVIVSVGLNLLLGGVMLGRFAGPDRDVRRIDPMFGARRILTELPEARSEALAPHFHRYFAALRPRFREIRSIQQDLKTAMLTDPLDAEALSQALGAFQSQLAESQRGARDAFVALAGAMTLEERRQLVSIMGEPPRRSDGLHKPPHDGPPHGLPPPPGPDGTPMIPPPP